jgi:hypothetical protein
VPLSHHDTQTPRRCLIVCLAREFYPAPPTPFFIFLPYLAGDGTFSAYTLPDITERSGWGCTGQRFCSTFKGMWVYRTQWMLPQGFKCDHCKLQWVSGKCVPVIAREFVCADAGWLPGQIVLRLLLPSCLLSAWCAAN